MSKKLTVWQTSLLLSHLGFEEASSEERALLYILFHSRGVRWPVEVGALIHDAQDACQKLLNERKSLAKTLGIPLLDDCEEPDEESGVPREIDTRRIG